MARVEASTRVDAPVDVVWTLLLDWEGSTRWMPETTTVEVIGTRREGVGTRVRAVTRKGGARLVDEMVVTRWEPLRLIEVRHLRAPLRGVAWFEIRPDGAGTRIEWVEEMDPPLRMLGEAAARVLKGPIGRILARSLARFRAIAEARA